MFGPLPIRTYGGRMSAARLPLAAAALAAGLAGVPGAASAAWRAPVTGAVVGRFAVGGDPFAAGQRRGIDLAARPGETVRAPCAGRVAFAGALPDRGGAVSIRCGGLTATVLGLGPPAVRRGTSVRAGDRLGAAGRDGVVRLGARRTGARFGYRDPQLLLAAPTRAPPPPLGPRGGRVRRAGPPPAPPARVVMGPAVDRRAPAIAWAGLALVAAGLPAGALVGVRGRGRRPRRAATVAK
jgi:hypothetical protein